MITIVTAVDNHHLNELLKTLPTWISLKGFDKYPFLIIYDADQLTLNDPRFQILKSLNVKYVPWKDPNKLYETQREKMLTALTVLPGLYVETEWYLKIDTDCTATNTDKWFDESWLKKDYVFITNYWGFTKPKNAIELLDHWSRMYFGGKYNPLNIPYDENDSKIKHDRIISWIFFCKTSWSKEIAEFFKYGNEYKLPSISEIAYKVSQDTSLWYVAAIRKDKYKTFNFKSKGWKHGRVL